MKSMLRLNVETVRTLTDDEAFRIVGGKATEPGPPDTNHCNGTFTCQPCDGSVYAPPPTSPENPCPGATLPDASCP